jgi:hypothetical protein
MAPQGVNHQADSIGYDVWLVELNVMTALLRNNQLAVT